MHMDAILNTVAYASDLIAFLEADYSAMSPNYDCAAGEDVQRSSSLAP